jgi:uncharacterized tellurite resistance protein B-like protein
MAEKLNTIENLPEYLKELYTQLLVGQALADGYLHPKELIALYNLMVTLDFGVEARARIRDFISSDKTPHVLEMALLLISKAEEKEQDNLKFSVIKDLIRIAKEDGFYHPQERANTEVIALSLYEQAAKRAGQVIELATKMVELDKKIAEGTISESELKKFASSIASSAAAIGVPLTALYFSGSVIGLSAAGITSGLATLGLGGLLGLSAMATGIGVVVGLGIVTFMGVKWFSGWKEREKKAAREHLLQEILKIQQKSMTALAEDLNYLASRLETLAAKSEENKIRLQKLIKLYQDTLKAMEQEGEGEAYATSRR